MKVNADALRAQFAAAGGVASRLPGAAPACHSRWHCLHLLQRLDDFGHVVQLAGVRLEGELHLHAAAKPARRGEFARGRALKGLRAGWRRLAAVAAGVGCRPAAAALLREPGYVCTAIAVLDIGTQEGVQLT